jgi:Pyruvate/2-oxoacid:ferredoxin oxidoreductase delta subunit
MDNLISFVIAAFIIGASLLYYLKQEKKKAAATREAADKGKLRSDGPQSQHPHIDNTQCIGCATCTMVCPESDVLGMVGGKAMIINGYKCIGHGICADFLPSRRHHHGGIKSQCRREPADPHSSI